MAASDDVMTAFVTKWKANAPLQASFADGPRGGEIPSPLPTPYVQHKAAKDREPEYSSGGVSVHWIRQSLTVWGNKADCNTIVGQMATCFEGACPGTAKTLSVPNSVHMVTLPGEAGTLEMHETRKDGEEIWKGVVEYVVMLQRSVP